MSFGAWGLMNLRECVGIFGDHRSFERGSPCFTVQSAFLKNQRGTTRWRPDTFSFSVIVVSDTLAEFQGQLESKCIMDRKIRKAGRSIDVPL